MPALVPIVIAQGVTSALRVDTPITEASGWKFTAQIRPEPGSQVVLADWPDGSIEVWPLVLLVPLDPEVTELWDWDRAWFGLEATSPEGQVTRLVQRPVILDREVVIQ